MMMQKLLPRILATFIALTLLVPAIADDHRHGAQDDEKPTPPKVFLDKNPRIVKYQLGRLDNTRLLMVERGDDDKKYLPVHEAILLRPGMALQDREQALTAISIINESNPVSEIFAQLDSLKDDNESQQVAKQLGRLTLAQKPKLLSQNSDALIAAANSENEAVRTTGLAALIVSGDSVKALELSGQNEQSKIAFLQGITLIGDQKTRNGLRDSIAALLGSNESEPVKLNAIKTMAAVNTAPGKTFQQISPFLTDAKLRRVAVKTLIKIPRKHRDPKTATTIADVLVKHAEDTPKAERTSDEFLEAMQLADQMLGLIDADQSKQFRERLEAVVVRVILIHTVEEEMRYDVPWFAVQAGSDIQVVLKNEDLMPHNLVIAAPGALQDVAIEGAAIGPKIGPSGKQYVPVSDDVLYATQMVSSEKQDRLTFKVPSAAGEYPYVCTFPGHWMRMYGVMVVVEDLAEFQRNPITPKDPVGSDRSLVQAWKAGDLGDDIDFKLRGRSPEIGKKLFAEATCAQCHIVAGEGKAVGPELTDVWSRWKGDAEGIYREIVEPSHKIEPKYVVRKIVTIDGEVIAGIVLAEDKDSISILPNPESTEPTVVPQDDIEDMVQSSVSIMPKGLMDRFTEDEILEIIGYLQTVDPKK